MKVKLQITAAGGVQMLHSDAVDLTELGQVEITRASNVEWSNERQAWYVQSALTLVVLSWFASREAALAWEKDYYSPDGPGWPEINFHRRVLELEAEGLSTSDAQGVAEAEILKTQHSLKEKRA